MMDATLILIDSDAELARARALVDRLWPSVDPADVARLAAQARLIAACSMSRKSGNRFCETGHAQINMRRADGRAGRRAPPT
jgi:hypothetical protein